MKRGPLDRRWKWWAAVGVAALWQCGPPGQGRPAVDFASWNVVQPPFQQVGYGVGAADGLRFFTASHAMGVWMLPDVRQPDAAARFLGPLGGDAVAVEVMGDRVLVVSATGSQGVSVQSFRTDDGAPPAPVSIVALPGYPSTWHVEGTTLHLVSDGSASATYSRVDVGADATLTVTSTSHFPRRVAATSRWIGFFPVRPTAVCS